MCTTYEPYTWEEQSIPQFYYLPTTNQFWSVDITKDKVLGFGISLPDFAWRKCTRERSDDEILKIQLGVDAKTILGEDFYEYIDSAYLSGNVKISFDRDDSRRMINRIDFDCNYLYLNPPKIEGLGCRDTQASILASSPKNIIPKCGPVGIDGSQELIAYFNPKSGIFWSLDSNRSIISYGITKIEDRNWHPCDQWANMDSLAALKKEMISRESHKPPLPLKFKDRIFKIKGMTLGSGSSLCPDIKSELWSEDRMIINVCSIMEPDSSTFAYFDINKEFVVKITRYFYVNDRSALLESILDVYGRDAFQQKDNVYLYGDIENSRGLEIQVGSCYEYRNGRMRFSYDLCAIKSEYVVVITLIDVGAFREAENDGKEAFLKREF